MIIEKLIYLMSLLPDIWLVFPNSKGKEKAHDLLETLLHKKIIGNKHTPEKNIIKSKIQWLNKQERKEFRKEYKELITKQLIIREKKRTKKGTDWHISLNPERIKEIYRILEESM